MPGVTPNGVQTPEVARRSDSMTAGTTSAWSWHLHTNGDVLMVVVAQCAYMQCARTLLASQALAEGEARLATSAKLRRGGDVWSCFVTTDRQPCHNSGQSADAAACCLRVKTTLRASQRFQSAFLFREDPTPSLQICASASVRQRSAAT